MPFEIVESCVGCDACKPLCPNKAISEVRQAGAPLYFINPEKCTECIGDFDLPQCAEICPVEGAIVDEYAEPLNPPGSLTGIPLHLLYRLKEVACRP